ncbi:SMEK domain-containing protein [Erwinia sp. S59]|uniref:SMEK domain-containing protein n=1 Tax=Erwinia sp. S59 TaxID=2769340 RepID=UPI00190D517B|nr:SMEK domain-containing protein [Erwinia sp. S59]MBK0091786.1 SMEK domain-containing protein [Erwinia sp. S59]
MYTRKEMFDNISKSLAILRYDIEQHQSINDFSLNIHGEDLFKNIMNGITLGAEYVNANTGGKNEPYIDLVDHKNKEIIQVTTTRTKEKILNTLNVYNAPKYKKYNLNFLYLLNKPNLKTESVTEIKVNFGIDIKPKLKDHNDLLSDIKSLSDADLEKLYAGCFSYIETRYTDEEVLDLVFRKLIRDYKKVKKRYDDTFGSIEVTEKLELNKINERVRSAINTGLDYSSIVQKIDNGETVSELQSVVVDDFYKDILRDELKAKVKLDENLTVADLHDKALEFDVDFSKMLGKLAERVAAAALVDDFNSMNIPWVIIAYYFEICEVGRK